MEKLISGLFPCVREPKLASEDEVMYEQNRQHEAKDTAFRALQELQAMPQRNVSQLLYKEVITLFRLKRDQQPVFKLQDSESIPVPKRLGRELEDVQSFLADHSDKEISRLRLNEILKTCTLDERAISRIYWNKTRRLFCTPEGNLTVVVKHGGRFELVNSTIDYSIWNDVENMGASLIVARAREGAFDAGLKECLAYLAMIQNIRKQNYGQIGRVYGVVSDSFDFTFVRVDSDLHWGVWRSLKPWNDSERAASQIYTLLRHLIRDSTSTSMPCSNIGNPIKYKTAAQNNRAPIWE